MKDRGYWILGGGAVAAFLVWKQGEKQSEDGGAEFKEGFTAGFFTPGPFTILALAGVVAWHT